jgi:hypothetical protein
VVARATHVIKCFVRGPHYSASLERLKSRINEFRFLVDNALSGIEVAGIVLAVLGVLVKGVGGSNEMVTGQPAGRVAQRQQDHVLASRSTSDLGILATQRATGVEGTARGGRNSSRALMNWNIRPSLPACAIIPSPYGLPSASMTPIGTFAIGYPVAR